MEKSRGIAMPDDKPPLENSKGEEPPSCAKQIPVEPNPVHYTPLDISPCGCCIGDRVIRMVRKDIRKHPVVTSAHLFSIRNPGGYFISSAFVANDIYSKA